jgi:hypothetical protein
MVLQIEIRKNGVDEAKKKAVGERGELEDKAIPLYQEYLEEGVPHVGEQHRAFSTAQRTYAYSAPLWRLSCAPSVHAGASNRHPS